MVHTEKWVPGAVTAGVSFNLPSYAPGIARIAGAYILRAAGQSLNDHAAAAVAASVDDHVVHDHNLTTVDSVVPGGGAAMTEPAIAGPFESAATAGTNPGAVDVLAAAQAHAATGVAVVHVLGATANPTVAATATKVSRSSVSSNVNVLAGDVFVLRYVAEGFAIQS